MAKGKVMTLAYIILAFVWAAITAALATRYVQNEKKNKFVWRRLTRWGRARRYALAVFFGSASILLAVLVAIFYVLVPPAPQGFVRKAQDFAARVDDRFSPP